VGDPAELPSCREDCTLLTPDDPPEDGRAVCGDGVVDPGEGCDAGVNNSNRWPDACRRDCQPARCGDGVRDAGEECDLGFGVFSGDPAGLPPCRDDCTLRRPGDPGDDPGSDERGWCGDGIVQPGELCDDGPNNSNRRPDACRRDCRPARCGDGVLDSDEECDLPTGLFVGDPAELPSCREDCTLLTPDDPPEDGRAVCGDGVVDPGEGCDDGPNNSNRWPDACRRDCQPARCGDGVRDAGEACDLGFGWFSGDPADLPPCDDDCTLRDPDDPGSDEHGWCGDGVVQAGEACDAGANNSDVWGDACRTDCRAAHCGDGVRDEGEACDQGSVLSLDDPAAARPCRDDCTLRPPSPPADPDDPPADGWCGDGVVGPNEDCDLGAGNSDWLRNTCRTDCRHPRCGDGVRDRGEQCDLGSVGTLDDPDGPLPCQEDCTRLPTCGDGAVDPGEECDDGVQNRDGLADACRTDCRLPRCGDGTRDTGEACDIGSASLPPGTPAGLHCRPDCTLGGCGDGVVGGAEACDDGAANSDVRPDACRTDCSAPRCGDGVVDSGETCDDGAATGDPSVSLCLPGCRQLAELVVWPPDGEVTIGFEDLPLGSSDYDYNDWVSTFSVKGTYDTRGRLWGLEFSNRPHARGAGYDHAQHIAIPGSVIRASGSYVVRWYRPDGTLISEAAPVPFAAGQALDIVSFANTAKALPGKMPNTTDCTGLVEGNEMRLGLRFARSFLFDLGDLSPDAVGPHGAELFFDPYLHVHNTGQDIHQGDRRMVVVPRSWAWPQEGTPIWTAYQGCVFKGDPPRFNPGWYYCTPTAGIFQPYCKP
jgi:LruC domain-containing protein